MNAQINARIAHKKGKEEKRPTDQTGVVDQTKKHGNAYGVGGMTRYKAKLAAMIVVDIMKHIGHQRRVRRPQSCHQRLDKAGGELVEDSNHQHDSHDQQQLMGKWTFLIDKERQERQKYEGSPNKFLRIGIPEPVGKPTSRIVEQYHQLLV